MIKSLTAGVAALGLFAIVVPAFAAEIADAEVTKAAVDLAHRYDTNYAAKDADAMAELYAADGVLVSPAGPLVKGREALKAYYVKRFASGARGHHIEVLETHAQGDGGYAITKFSVTVPGKDGALHDEHGSIVTIYRHGPDGWHMRLVQPSVPASAG